MKHISPNDYPKVALYMQFYLKDIILNFYNKIVLPYFSTEL